LLAGVAAAQSTSCMDTKRPAQDPAVDPLLKAVNWLLATDDVDKALALVVQHIAAHPGDSRLEEARGRVLYRDGKLGEAIDAFNLAIKLDPCDGAAHMDAWRVNAMAGLYDAASRQLEIAKTVWPTQPTFQRMWANTQMPLPPGVVADNPPHFNFYARHYDCDGIPVRSANVVNAAALPAACVHIREMLSHIPNVKANLIARGAELHIIGEAQHISDLPESRNDRGERIFTRPGDTANSPEKVDIDALAGATGGLYANCPEMNLLHLPQDTYGVYAEVCIHEFAHDIMNAGFDSAMRSQISRTYEVSMKKGLWKGAYAASNANEWWAEISEWYFGAQGSVSRMTPPSPAPGPDALKLYDPEAFALVDRFYSGSKQPKVVHERILKPARGTGTGANSNSNEATVLFVNDSAVRRYIFWVDQDGIGHNFGFIEPYSRKVIHDYVGRCWMIVDPRTKERLLFPITDEESEIIVS
jgi:tetratricopeptide (TPR) repeat protein